MDNEQLIEIVKKYEYLYDLTDKRYSDNHRKDQTWNEKGMILKRNGTDSARVECRRGRGSGEVKSGSVSPRRPHAVSRTPAV
ncbi:unnamed protein product [Parnassius mnemosyne]|uniref:MADF domain-containing protein n=1 Tax=Parnassius mnemosyne TaxID=213953 RepID=A0AAV1L3T0_9NEOP